MVGKTAPIKRQDEIRFEVIRTYIGCLCCALAQFSMSSEDIALTTIEHCTENGRRLDDEHQATIGLCPWHHQAVPWAGKRQDEMASILGPSLAQGRKPFEEHFGDEILVLLPLVDQLIIWFSEYPWPEYTMPMSIRAKLRMRWKELRNQREL
jgi:hypothetical protein